MYGHSKCGTQDLSSLTRDWSHASCSGSSGILVVGPPGKSSSFLYFPFLSPSALFFLIIFVSLSLSISASVFLSPRRGWVWSWNDNLGFTVGPEEIGTGSLTISFSIIWRRLPNWLWELNQTVHEKCLVQGLGCIHHRINTFIIMTMMS